MSVPVPSSALARGFEGPDHRARVQDALCAGEIAVWGEVEQAVLRSHESGELHADITERYARLVGACEQPAYCNRARTKLETTADDVHAFWLHILGTCGELPDRVHFRDYDAEPGAVASFYTAGDHPPHREGADDGALILATERLVARGALDEPLAAAIDTLLATEHPEAAQRLAALVPTANIDVARALTEGLVGQSHPDAIAVVEAACERTDEVRFCDPKPAPPQPDHTADWLADLDAASADPDRAMGLLEAHGDQRDQAVAHLASCGAPCAPQASLIDGDTTRFDEADALGLTPRPDRAGRAAFDHDWTALLHGRGRLATVDLDVDGAMLHDRVGRTLARLADPALDRVWFHELAPVDATPGTLAIEVDDRRFEVPLADETGRYDIDAVLALVNHALDARDAGWALHRLASDDADLAVVVALPDGALAALTEPGALTLHTP